MEEVKLRLIEVNKSEKLKLCKKNELFIDVLSEYNGQFLFKDYYDDDTFNMLNNCVSYIVRDRKIMWNVPYSELMVEDILNTFPELNDKEITLEVGFPMAGGPGKIVGRASVELFIYIISLKNPALGLLLTAGEKITEILIEFYEYYESKKITVVQQLDALIMYGEVGTLAVEELLKYDKYHAIKLLNVLGFSLNEKTGRFEMGILERNKLRAALSFMTEEQLRLL